MTILFDKNQKSQIRSPEKGRFFRPKLNSSPQIIQKTCNLLVNMIRILQCVYSMDRGGVETWLMHVLRRLDRRRYRVDFLTHTQEPGDYDDEIERLGGGIVTCCHPRHIWRYPRELKKLLRQHGPYDVVHSHSPANASVI